LEEKEYANIIFASAPSQNDFLAEVKKKDIAWDRIIAFHMDEYVGLDKDASQGFGNYLKDRLFNSVSPYQVHYLNGNAGIPESECTRYADLLKKYPTDIVCLGIGENTHLAFNDPHVADFKDSKVVKVVELDEQCRLQQVNDGCFNTIDEVPRLALTITIPALFRARYASAVVPGHRKADAIYHTLNSEISEKYPSTLLRKHKDTVLYIDEQSAQKL
ncbi:MAG TPA: 6-phosphogluconolactonase, partial [Flavisolibacter sp.]|nr:6-phosphogluconolactonase [Flavisolibacter sp.]